MGVACISAWPALGGSRPRGGGARGRVGRLDELAAASKVGVEFYEARVPVRPAVRAACEMLGFDPLYVANEGKLIAIVRREDAGAIFLAMRSTRYGGEGG